jgi:hypothetical protein
VSRLLTEGQEYIEESPIEDTLNSVSEIEILQAQVSELKEEVNTIKTILLRQYGAYKVSFGDQAIVTTDSADKWVAIKGRLAPRLREAIDIILLQGSMKRKQLAAAMHLGYDNCATNVVSVLIRQGWLVENNGSLSLKVL